MKNSVRIANEVLAQDELRDRAAVEILKGVARRAEIQFLDLTEDNECKFRADTRLLLGDYTTFTVPRAEYSADGNGAYWYANQKTKDALFEELRKIFRVSLTQVA